ncbi:HD domain-containing protein [Aureibaculum marinum]|uniref:HD domain-containing protein n=1 Tax=Aureibaculum marinum TaxID=2487930 RepID=A0A3N4P1Q1_9FLAO|nr:Pycsar system effector family protein [Aureibaculum marinum]RPD97759.1 HD domain-containing protein [Aureibaculum marinum]
MTIVQKVESYVVSQLTEHLPDNCIYHNLGHTRRVVNFVRELSEFEEVSEEDKQILEIAAWFHDIGFVKSNENHETLGVQIAREFLQEQNISKSIIDKVVHLILFTTKNTEPNTLLEKIILDADCGHLGNSGYSELNELLREEWEQKGLFTFSDAEWTQENINFLTNHQFYTDYAFSNWQMGKDQNLAKLYKLQKKQKLNEEKNIIKKAELKLKQKKASIPERGIETMFRVTLRNHIDLSNIADTKANILLSVNAIIISMSLSNLIPKLDSPSNEFLIIPTAIFVAFSLLSMGLSVLATRPNVTSGKFTKKDVEEQKVNLLFFGNFHKVKLEDFEWAMGEMMNDRDYLYSSMKKDLYYLGLVLHKKYKILRITYTIFLIGIALSVIAFAISFQLANLG